MDTKKLLLVQAQQCPDLKQYIMNKQYLSNDIVNEMIKLMSNVVVRQILSEIREATIYSIIADEATDITQKEQLWLTIRSVDNNFRIHKDLVELIQVPKTDSETLFTVIKDSFCTANWSVPWPRL